jgi:hypothetical protein
MSIVVPLLKWLAGLIAGSRNALCQASASMTVEGYILAMILTCSLAIRRY